MLERLNNSHSKKELEAFWTIAAIEGMRERDLDVTLDCLREVGVDVKYYRTGTLDRPVRLS
jgi:hypothetical protein